MSLYQDSLSKTNEYGEVVSVLHPIVNIVGLPTVKNREVLVFENGKVGQVKSIKKDNISVLLFSTTPVNVGQKVTRLNILPSIEIKDDLLGKVVDGLGNIVGPISDNMDSEKANKTSKAVDLLDKLPPGMDTRVDVKQQFITGVSIVDLLVPVGLGQRELVVGDRKTGKTSFLLTILKNHVIKTKGVVVYVTIGSNISDIKNIQNFIKKHKLEKNVVIVSTTSNSPHGNIILSPYTGMTIAEYYKKMGKDVVIVLDDLSTHAMYYREVSILSRRFPGRDSYPGDIFYLHARLLERAGNYTTKESKKGSITCFPVAQTTQNDLSDYIVSNLISITDGHLLFDPIEFGKGRRPAINISLSVTRLGRQTQTILLQDISRQLSSFLTTKYEKSLQLSHFGSELTEEVQRDLEIGNRLYDFFNQDIGTVVLLNPSIVFLSMIWLNIFKKESRTKLLVYRSIFIKSYINNPNTATFIDSVTNAKSFKQVLIKVMGEKNKLIQICKAKKS